MVEESRAITGFKRAREQVRARDRAVKQARKIGGGVRPVFSEEGKVTGFEIGKTVSLPSTSRDVVQTPKPEESKVTKGETRATQTLTPPRIGDVTSTSALENLRRIDLASASREPSTPKERFFFTNGGPGERNQSFPAPKETSFTTAQLSGATTLSFFDVGFGKVKQFGKDFIGTTPVTITRVPSPALGTSTFAEDFIGTTAFPTTSLPKPETNIRDTSFSEFTGQVSNLTTDFIGTKSFPTTRIPSPVLGTTTFVDDFIGTKSFPTTRIPSPVLGTTTFVEDFVGTKPLPVGRIPSPVLGTTTFVEDFIGLEPAPTRRTPSPVLGQTDVFEQFIGTTPVTTRRQPLPALSGIGENTKSFKELTDSINESVGQARRREVEFQPGTLKEFEQPSFVSKVFGKTETAIFGTLTGGKLTTKEEFGSLLQKEAPILKFKTPVDEATAKQARESVSEQLGKFDETFALPPEKLKGIETFKEKQEEKLTQQIDDVLFTSGRSKAKAIFEVAKTESKIIGADILTLAGKKPVTTIGATAAIGVGLSQVPFRVVLPAFATKGALRTALQPTPSERVRVGIEESLGVGSLVVAGVVGEGAKATKDVSKVLKLKRRIKKEVGVSAENIGLKQDSRFLTTELTGEQLLGLEASSVEVADIAITQRTGVARPITEQVKFNSKDLDKLPKEFVALGKVSRGKTVRPGAGSKKETLPSAPKQEITEEFQFAAKSTAKDLEKFREPIFLEKIDVGSGKPLVEIEKTKLDVVFGSFSGRKVSDSIKFKGKPSKETKLSGFIEQKKPTLEEFSPLFEGGPATEFIKIGDQGFVTVKGKFKPFEPEVSLDVSKTATFFKTKNRIARLSPVRKVGDKVVVDLNQIVSGGPIKITGAKVKIKPFKDIVKEAIKPKKTIKPKKKDDSNIQIFKLEETLTPGGQVLVQKQLLSELKVEKKVKPQQQKLKQELSQKQQTKQAQQFGQQQKQKQKQKQQTQQLRGVLFKQSLKQDQFVGLKKGTIQKQRLKVAQAISTAQAVGQASKQDLRLKQDLAIAQKLKVEQKLESGLKTKTILKPVLIPGLGKPGLTPGEPFIPKRPGKGRIPFKFDFKLPRGSGKLSKPSKKLTRELRFQPSIVAKEYKITGKKKKLEKETLIGLETRAIPI